MYSARELEEERRLFYVAITRAKRFCNISYARSRFRYGTMTFSEPSQFIEEINSSYLSVYTSKKQSHSDFLNFDSDEDFDGFQPRKSRFTVRKTVSYSKPSYLSSSDEVSRLSFKKVARVAPANDAPKKLNNARTQSGEVISEGQIVEHPRFGRGKVISFTDAGDTVKAHIAFDNSGEKDLLLKFAPLKIIK